MPVIRKAVRPCRYTAFWRVVGNTVKGGDVIALSGALGTGKSALARAIIQPSIQPKMKCQALPLRLSSIMLWPMELHCGILIYTALDDAKGYGTWS